MKETQFPSLEEALYLHTILLERFGGAPGLIDRGLLESALGRPRSGYYKSLSQQSAALLHSLAKNHCFVDGNKRVALALTAAFLIMNGYRLAVEADEAERFIWAVAAGEIFDLIEITGWIERYLIPGRNE